MKTKKVLLLTTLFLFVIILMAMVPTKLFAAIPAEMSQEFRSILNENGELVITDTSEFYRKEDFVTDVLMRHSNDNYYFNYLYATDEQVTTCFIERREVSTNDLLEKYEIPIKYEEKFSEEFKKILDENYNLVITNSSYGGIEEAISFYCNLMSTQSLWFSAVYDGNLNGTTCTIQMSKMYDEYTSQIVEQHIVNIIQEEKFSEEFKKLLDENYNLVITNSNLGGMQELVELQCKLLSTESLIFSPFFNENWNGTACTIILNEVDENYNYQPIEQHLVNIIEEEKYSDEFKKILNNENKIVITDSTQGDKVAFVESYCDKFWGDDFEFNVINSNENGTECTIGLYKKVPQQYGGYLADLVEQHLITVSFEEKYSDEFKKILNDENGILITSSSLGEKRDLVSNYIGNFSTEELIYSCNEINEDGTVCTISISKVNPDTYMQYVVEQHVVKVSYEEKISDDFKKYLDEDGNIVIKSSRDYDKEELLWYYCNAISDYEGMVFDTSYVNEEGTACTLRMYTYGENYNQIILEQHIVNIVYDKKMSDDFKSVLENGKFVINSVKPNTEEEWWSLSEVLFMSMKENPWYISYEEEDLSALDLTIIDSNGYPETHRVETVFNYDKNIKKVADEILKKIPENEEFMVKDFELINYWLNGGKNETLGGAGKFDNYSGELKALAENKNFNIIVDDRMGANDEFSTLRGGIALLQYNGVTYGIRHCIEIIGNHILYVPDDTASTKEALLSAIQKRVDEYAGRGKVKITAGEGTILEYYTNASIKEKQELQDKIAAEKAKENPNKVLIYQLEMQLSYVDEYIQYFLDSYNDPEGEYNFLKSAEGGYWFKATIDGEDYEFIVVKDSSKMITPLHKTADIATNIEISSTSTSVPLDTAIEAQKLITGEEYERIMKILNVKENDTFDLRLYSNSLEKYITKLEDGNFEVRIPLSDKFKNKSELWVYYVDENKGVLEYSVEIKDGYAMFTTDHFSIYTLSDKRVDTDNKVNGSTTGDENQANINNTNTDNSTVNVKTGDNIMLYVCMFIISLIGILATRKIKKV